jgi:hypothetical protein
VSQKFWLSAAAISIATSDISDLSEHAAWEMFMWLRWGDSGTQKCSWCGAVDKHYFIRTRKQWHCKACNRRFSAKTGSPYQNSKLSYKHILLGWFSFIKCQQGMPALELRRDLRHTYKTCFTFFGRLREALVKTVDPTPLSGEIHIDGGHFSGRPRKGRVKKKVDLTKEQIEIPSRFATDEAREHRAKAGKRVNHFHHNRRIVIVIRELHKESGIGACRTKVAVCKRESRPEIEALVKAHVVPGSTISTDEWGAYCNLGAMGYTHKAVNHKEEFSDPDGVNENQAESYFSRLRRAVLGTYNRVTPHYMLDYATEMAWREDLRRTDLLGQLIDFAKRIFAAGISTDWLNYNRGHHRTQEKLFKAPRKKKASQSPVPIQSQ